ncbi:MAG: NADP-dependent malic enzyme [Synergistetes bacterium]|nr:NADP-dependent malic enzyme [Synergistota bacterium]
MMGKKADVEALLKKAEKPSMDAIRLYPLYEGKIQIAPKVPIRDFRDFAVWYTPGVAAPCKIIRDNKKQVYKYTNKANVIAIISDGTRILGLGNIGPEAGLPVMEGKALLFKYLGGVDAIPLCIDTTDIDEIVSFCKWISPSIGGINLEDIESPKCFYLLDRLKKELSIPVFHDDQQGTAVITLAALTNALRVVNKDIAKVKIALIGMGANTANLRLILKAGARPENVIACDINGILGRHNADNFERRDPRHYFAMITNPEGKKGGIKEAIEGADVCIAFSKPGPGTIKPEWIKSMAKDAIVFACANPVPEIWPWEAKEAGARVVATGRSDFPNQVNNSLGFPAIFRGALEVRATEITDEMCIAAANAIADFAFKKGLHEDYIVPTMDDEEMYVEEAIAVAKKAIEQGVAQEKLDNAELKRRISEKLRAAKEMSNVLQDSGLIADYF